MVLFIALNLLNCSNVTSNMDQTLELARVCMDSEYTMISARVIKEYVTIFPRFDKSNLKAWNAVRVCFNFKLSPTYTTLPTLPTTAHCSPCNPEC